MHVFVHTIILSDFINLQQMEWFVFSMGYFVYMELSVFALNILYISCSGCSSNMFESVDNHRTVGHGQFC